MTLPLGEASGATRPSQLDIFAWSQSNPLAIGVPGPMGFLDWNKALFNDATPWIGSRFPVAQSYRLLKKVKNVFVPSEQDAELAINIHLAMLESIDMADPRCPENRELRHKYSLERPELIGLTPYQQGGAAGAIMKGPTGSGKSSFSFRFTSLFLQVIVHDRAEYGWISYKQLVWLRAEMPADGSRSGLIKSIAIAMDVALGTDYVDQLSKIKRIDAQLGTLLHWLRLHSCSLLILEEAQKENLNTLVLGRETVKFFLRMLNIGTPVVLIGNPNAFVELEADSQDLSRFSEIGIYEYYPEMDWKSERWDDLVTHIWGFTVFSENKDKKIPDLHEFLWRSTGGNPRFLARLRRLSLYQALVLGNDFVEEEAIALALEMEPMRNVKNLIDAYVERDTAKLKAFPDQPVQALGARWARFEAARKAGRGVQGETACGQGTEASSEPAQASAATNTSSPKKATTKRPIAPKRSEGSTGKGPAQAGEAA